MRSVLRPLLKITTFAVITVLLTGTLGLTIANTLGGEMSPYSARFSDVTGLTVGDDVRMSGVRIGQVTAIETEHDEHAKVGFTVSAERTLPAGLTAQIKYRNLIGRRYLALDTGGGGSGGTETGRTFAPGEVIPLNRTTPALNLTALFNGFRPLFRAIEPDQVNQLAGELVQVLQGEAGTVEGVLSHVGSLTKTLAGKDKVIGNVVDNLNKVLDTVHGRKGKLSTLIDQLQKLTTGLAQQRRPIGEAIDAIGGLTDTTAGLLRDARAPLSKSVSELRTVAKNLNKRGDLVENFVSGLSHKVSTIGRTVSHGGWFNYYLCSMDGKVGISDLGIEVDLPLLPLPGAQRPDRCGP